MSSRTGKKTNPDNPENSSSIFFLFVLFVYIGGHIFPRLKKNKRNLEPYRLRGDGSCPFCSGSQVWVDNYRVCAAETDDYRLYCLSQAQSTLIQQSHLSLIYESRSLFPHPSIPYFLCSYARFWLFFPSLSHVPHCRVSTSCHLTVQWKERIEPLQVPPLLGCLWW